MSLRLPVASLVLSLLVTACGAEREAAEPSATPAGVIRAERPRRGRHEELVGRWSPTLPPREARAIAITRAALADPPNDAALEAIDPTTEDRTSYQNLLRLRATEPNGPMLAKVRRQLAAFEGILVEITPTTIGWKTPGGAPELRQGYRVIAEDGDNVTLAVQDEQYDVRVLDRNHLSMRGSIRTFLLTRDTALAADAVTTQAAWNGDRIGRVIPGPGAPRDACTAYADCIDQMPRFSNDGGGMLASASTIRSWARTPERLEQCASALEMARVATLCR